MATGSRLRKISSERLEAARADTAKREATRDAAAKALWDASPMSWERISVERWIFSAAHELGHLLLHPMSYDSSKHDEPRAEEKEADTFASYFLMPEMSFKKESSSLARLSSSISRVSSFSVNPSAFRCGRERSVGRVLYSLPNKERLLKRLYLT